MIGGEHEKGLSYNCSDDATLPGSNAIWLFPVGEILVYTIFWSNGFPFLQGAKGVVDIYMRNIGIIISAILQDCSWENGMEYHRCNCCHRLDSTFHL